MCELTYMLILSAKNVAGIVIARILKLSSKRHRLKPFEVSPHDCEQSFAANLRTVIAYDRLFSHPALKKSLKLLLQTLRVVESYPFTKFDKIPLINFADFSSL